MRLLIQTIVYVTEKVKQYSCVCRACDEDEQIYISDHTRCEHESDRVEMVHAVHIRNHPQSYVIIEADHDRYLR